MKLNIETKYKMGDMVQILNKDIGVVECMEVRHTIEGTVIKYTVNILSRGSTIKSAWCDAKDLSPYSIPDTVTASDVL